MSLEKFLLDQKLVRASIAMQRAYDTAKQVKGALKESKHANLCIVGHWCACYVNKVLKDKPWCLGCEKVRPVISRHRLAQDYVRVTQLIVVKICRQRERQWPGKKK